MSNSTIKSFGVLVNSLWIDQSSYTIIRGLNRFVEVDSKWSPVVFHLNHSPTMGVPLFSRMAMENLMYFGHPAISTCLETSEILLNAVGPTKKFAYLWNLDWLYHNDTEEKYRGVYSNSSLNLIVRCKEHAHLLERCWLVRPSGLFIVEDFRYDKIARILQDE